MLEKFRLVPEGLLESNIVKQSGKLQRVSKLFHHTSTLNCALNAYIRVIAPNKCHLNARKQQKPIF